MALKKGDTAVSVFTCTNNLYELPYSNLWFFFIIWLFSRSSY